MADGPAWGSDVAISRPVPHEDITNVVSVPLQGFAFTPQGLTFDLTQAAAEETYQPRYAPVNPHG